MEVEIRGMRVARVADTEDTSAGPVSKTKWEAR